MIIVSFNFPYSLFRFTQLTVNNQSDHDNQQEKQLLGPLREAEQFGRLSGNCEEKYSNCN